jgi:hypothetical protein
MPQTDLKKAREKAKLLGVSVRPSKNKTKKLDVYDKTGNKVATIGDIKYEDFNTHGDVERRRLYKSRHEKNRHKKGTASYFADQILWWPQTNKNGIEDMGSQKTNLIPKKRLLEPQRGLESKRLNTCSIEGSEPIRRTLRACG